MKILILGGTGFSGRILTENLVKAGKAPVLFNRGKRNPHLFADLKKFRGNRDTGDIKQITSEDWDVVVDFSGQQPDNIDFLAESLKGKTGRYIFVSSASAYVLEDEAAMTAPIKEDFKTNPCNEEQRKSKDILANYSQKKAECERVILGKDWLDAIIFRPALIYGRYDPTDRFYYWLYRSKQCSKILIPDDGAARTTNTYSEDFAKLIEMALDIKVHNKVYNAVTHPPVSIKEYLNIASEKLGTDPQLISKKGEFFSEKGLQPWADIPMWLGGADLILDSTKVLNDFGIKFSSFEESVTGCINYYSSFGWPEPKYGLKLDRERELIKEMG